MHFYHSVRKRSALIAAGFFFLLFLVVFGLHSCCQNENNSFRKYTHALFCQELSGNTISLHYTLKNPAAFGLQNVPVSLGSYTTDTDAVRACLENELALLHSYDRNRLSRENRLTYDVLEDYYNKAFALAPYILYEDPLAPLTGVQAQLPIILSEYQFYTVSDVETYLKLLKKVPDYFQSVLAFEKEREAKGFLMSENAREDLITECNTFTGLREKNYLYSSFDERLEKLPASRIKNKETYREKNARYLKTYLFPAYDRLVSGLRTLKVTSESAGLSSLPAGRQCYGLIAASETGSDRTVDEMQEMTRAQILADLGDMQSALAKCGMDDLSSEESGSPTSDLFSGQGITLKDSNPLSILSVLQSEMKESFPSPPDADVQIKYVQESMENYLSPAFYMIPAIDNIESNVIYINAGHLPDDLSLFTTLAHEGYPGHLYQNIYYMNRCPDPIRCLISCGGYTEGWATYTEMISYYYAPMPKASATVMQKNTSILLGIYALADMGIHYDGWTLTDTIRFFDDYGITDREAISDLYKRIAADPANYLKYYIGYLEFLELKKEAADAWGENFTQKRFHKEVLDAGPVPFSILKQQLKMQ